MWQQTNRETTLGHLFDTQLNMKHHYSQINTILSARPKPSIDQLPLQSQRQTLHRGAVLKRRRKARSIQNNNEKMLKQIESIETRKKSKTSFRPNSSLNMRAKKNLSAKREKKIYISRYKENLERVRKIAPFHSKKKMKKGANEYLRLKKSLSKHKSSFRKLQKRGLIENSRQLFKIKGGQPKQKPKRVNFQTQESQTIEEAPSGPVFKPPRLTFSRKNIFGGRRQKLSLISKFQSENTRTSDRRQESSNRNISKLMDVSLRVKRNSLFASFQKVGN